MLDFFSESTLVALIGLFGGILLGLAARIGRFCTLGAIEDLFYGGNTLRLRMWGIVIGVSVIGTFGLSAAGLIDLGETLFLSRQWNPFASVVGGLLFGYGMALAGNCGYGALARLGGGDIRSLLIVIVMGVSAYVTLGGPLSTLRIWAFGGGNEVETLPTVAFTLSRWTGQSLKTSGILIGLAILVITLANKELLVSFKHVFWGAIAGIAIISGWAGTYWVSINGFDATLVVSHTFSAPLGETLLYAMTSSGSSISFGICSVVGVIIGAFIGSVIMGHFRWEACDDPRELRRQLLGAFLMGVGAVVAVGCSIGQGLSAFSVLAHSAPITLASIMVGAAVGLRQLILGFSPSI